MTLGYEVVNEAPLDPRADQVMVAMRDGARLATDVYLPEGRGRSPAVLVRLPYDKCGRYTFMPRIAPHFNARGYAFIVQDVRGKFRSEGETMPFVHEIEDGHDTLSWIAAQPWCDGQVGMWGDSYYGYTQWAAAASGHPALKAIVPRVTSTDFKVQNWWGDSIVLLYATQYLAENWLDRLMYFFHIDWNTRPLATAFDDSYEAIGKRSAAADLMVGINGPHALPQIPRRALLHRLRIPVLHSTGWFDNVSPYSFEDYERLTARGNKRHLQYLVADSTDHEMYHLQRWPVGDVADHARDETALEALIPEYVRPGLDFFDVFLKGKGEPKGFPRARWFLGNAGWRTSSAWPPPEGRELRLFLAAPERATRSAEGGMLLSAPEAAVKTARWVHDPSNLVPSTSTDPFSLMREWADEGTIQQREDVLTFSSEPMEDHLDLAGGVTAQLVLGSDCPSLHVHAKLCDVFPDGSARMLVRGEALVKEPEYGRSVQVRLSPTAHRLLPGHRLRLSVASSDHPLYLWHPGTDENPWLATRGVPNRQMLVTGGSTPSCVRLGVL